MANPKTLARVLKKSGMLEVPQINAMVKNTISLNLLKAGHKINVIPDYAEAQLDIRLLPGQDTKPSLTLSKKNWPIMT